MRRRKKRHSQQLRPQDHGDFFARVVAAETQAEKMAGAGLPRAEHAGRAPDGRQVEILRLAGAHPDLVPQGVVDHGVAVLAGKDGPFGESSIPQSPNYSQRIPALGCDLSTSTIRPQIDTSIPVHALKQHQL